MPVFSCLAFSPQKALCSRYGNRHRALLAKIVGSVDRAERVPA